MIGVTITVMPKNDTNAKVGSVSDGGGLFSVSPLSPGDYFVRLSYLGYKSVSKNVHVLADDVDMGTITMEDLSKDLKAVTVEGKQIRAQQNGDTSQFNADAYKTNPDATAEDLVGKMPGVTSDGTGVKVNGETVQQVLVDGKPFFGTDPTLALKNLPAEVVDKIQVFDKLSDQSTFTGFDDGNAQKTMNIITRRNKSQGVFGKVYAGYGTDDKYITGGNLNIFNGDRRISILGLSNNINQQNFSTEDILGATGGSQGRGGGGRGSGAPGGGNAANNFLVGQQGGIAKTHALGFNYSDNWGKKIKVTGSYFFNQTNTTNTSDVNRNYFTNPDVSTLYKQYDTTVSTNINHRFNLRMEYTIDSANKIIFTPSVSLQQNTTSSGTYASNSIDSVIQSITDNVNYAKNTGYNASGNLLFQHKFAKPRRTVSLNLNGSMNNKDGNGKYYSLNDFLISDTSTGRDQHWDQTSAGNSFGANVSYTEPVGKKAQFMVNYNPSWSFNNSDKETYNANSAGVYNALDTFFSNKYNNTYNTQRGGVNFRVGDRGMQSSLNIGANIQQANLNGDQQFPQAFTVKRSFTNVLPNGFFNYRYADGRNLRIMYRTSTDAPSISQLQNVVNISNPLIMSTGNASLTQAYQHTFIVRYGLAKAKSARNFFLNLYANKVQNYIGSATYLPRHDSLFTDALTNTTILINEGSQLTRPVNLDGYWNTRLFATYGMPLTGIKCNLNFIGGFNYSRIPGVINQLVNYTSNYIPTAGFVLSSNISENVDFTLSYTANYNVVQNTVQSQANNNYYNHTVSLRFNWIFLKNFVFNSNVTNNYYTAFSSTGNQSYYLWNAYIGYKFLKRSMEARISVYDLLNQNTSITRTVTETYIENTNTQVLRQYFMGQLTYTIRSFKGKSPMPEEIKSDDNGHPPMPPGMPFRPGGGPFMH